MYPATTPVTVEEYLRTSFSDGDREYVDGHIVERCLGEKNHSKTQGELIYYFRIQQSKLGTYAFPSQRVQVKPTRFRVPDVCVYIGSEPDEQVFHTPPFLVVEILSKDDRPGEIQEKIRDYTDFGVRFVWVIDPQSRRGYVYTKHDSFEAEGGILRTENPRLEVVIEDILTGNATRAGGA